MEGSIIQRAKKRKRPLAKRNPPRFLYRGDDNYRGGPIGRLIDHENGLPLDDKGNPVEYNSDEERDAARAAMNEQRATEIESHVTPGRKGIAVNLITFILFYEKCVVNIMSKKKW